MDIAPFRGIGQFGPAYQRMYENDVHAPGSVDRVLLARMVRMCPETRAHLYGGSPSKASLYRPGSRPAMETLAADAIGSSRSDEERVDAIAAFCSRLGDREPATGLEEMLFGGREEEIVARGSDWCTDVARVACVLCQVVGIPARLVVLANVSSAYSGHEIIEARRGGRWGAVDPLAGVVYRHLDGAPASTWDLMLDPSLVERHGRRPAQFAMAAIADYSAMEHTRYDFTVSGLNDYYRSILTMAEAGWPGGLRWLHAEEQ